jgi:hypothetical protein
MSLTPNLVNNRIGQYKKNIAEENKNNVFNTLYYTDRKLSTGEICYIINHLTKKDIKKVKLDAEEEYQTGNILGSQKSEILKNANKPKINIRTVQRIVKYDSRIEKEGDKYFISPSITDPRLLNPIEFGKTIYDAIIGSAKEIQEDDRDDQYYIKELNDFIIKIGCFITCMLIEAALPFNDKTISIKKREELVYHWIRNSIPLEYFFSTFRFIFDVPKHSHNWKIPIREIKQPIIDKLIKSFQELYPNIYDEYDRTKKRVRGKR